MNAVLSAATDALPRAPSAFMRLLHRSYFFGSAVSHFLMHRICPAGIALGVVLMVGSTLVMGQPRDSVNGVCSLAFAIVSIGLLTVVWRRATLSAQREIPRHATAGEPIDYTIRVTNGGRRTLQRAWLREVAPDPRPTLAEFVSRREPGEELRNGFDRRFVYYRWQWMMSLKNLFTGGVSTAEIRLKPKQTTTVTVRLVPQRRGVIALDDLRVLLPDPLGLFQRCRRVTAPAATVTVLPRRFRLPPIEMPGSARFQVGGDATSNSIGNAGEFVGLRDYRHGDSLRQIHWKSWARMGRPIVKELEDTHYPRYGLVLDTFAKHGEIGLFEDAVSVAASFAATIDTHESLLDLMFVKDQAHVVTAGRGLARAEKLLEVLAAVESEATPDFDQLLRLVLRHRDELTSCLVVLAGWDERRHAFTRALTRGGILAVPIIVGDGPAPLDVPGHWVQSGHLARDLGRLPSRLGVQR
jgi:uncharacterized protein (DUF58 family)